MRGRVVNHNRGGVALEFGADLRRFLGGMQYEASTGVTEPIALVELLLRILVEIVMVMVILEFLDNAVKLHLQLHLVKVARPTLGLGAHDRWLERLP